MPCHTHPLAGESLNPEEAEAAEKELEEMEQQLMDEQGLEMPRVPSAAGVAAAAGEAAAEQQQGAAAEAAAEEGEQGALEPALQELPSVPKSKVQLPGVAEGKAAAEEESAEPTRVLVAA